MSGMGSHMRGGGMTMRAERGPHGKAIRGAADPVKKKVSLKKLWPTIWALVKPRLGLIAVGLVLVAIKTLAGLTMPFLAKPLLDRGLKVAHPEIGLLPKLIAAVFTARGPRDLERTGDREPLAYFEGPWQVMAAACRGLGLEVEAQIGDYRGGSFDAGESARWIGFLRRPAQSNL